MGFELMSSQLSLLDICWICSPPKCSFSFVVYSRFQMLARWSWLSFVRNRQQLVQVDTAGIVIIEILYFELLLDLYCMRLAYCNNIVHIIIHVCIELIVLCVCSVYVYFNCTFWLLS